MAKWSVALFGHEKPSYYIQEVSTGKTVFAVADDPGDVGPDLKVHIATGNEKRNVPGDVVAFKPYEDRDIWTPTERKHFLIVTIAGPTRSQMEALCEPIFDLSISDETAVLKKRRFGIPVEDLKALGVNEKDMLDKEKDYTPTLRDLIKTECYDKLNERYVSDTDKLRLIDEG